MSGRFSFERERSCMYSREYHIVKIGRSEVGNIFHDVRKTENPWTIRLSVCREPTHDNPAPFKDIVLKGRFSSSDEAREFLSRPEVFSEITRLHSLYSHDGEMERIYGSSMERER